MEKIIIIGAGPAGLTAAYELLKSEKSYDVTILEETTEIGGISRTVRYKKNRMDIGGHRFFSKDLSVTRWWNQIMPMQGAPSFDDALLGRESQLTEDGPDPETEDQVMLVRRRISRIYYLKKFFDYPVSMKWQTFKNMGAFRTIKAGSSYLKATVIKRPETSLENFYINRFGKELYGMFFEGYTEKLWGIHPREISADWGAQRVKGLSITAVLKDMFAKLLPKSAEKKRKIETSLIEEFIYPKYGPGQLWETVASDIEKMGGKIIYNASVKNIITQNAKVEHVIYADKAGMMQTITGDRFISSMPLKDLVVGMNEVPAKTQEIAAGLPYRDFVTIGLLVDKLNLKNETNIKTLNNIVPDCWIYVQDTDVKLGRIQVFNNWSPYLVEKPLDTVWIGLEYFCQENDEFWNLSDDEAIEFATDELVKMGVINAPSDVQDSHREHVKKAYPAYFGTYDRVDEVIAYINTVDNLYCIGRNGQHRYNNMDHSMVTSFETVKNIIAGVTDKNNIWDVNTDKEYHEEGEKSE